MIQKIGKRFLPQRNQGFTLVELLIVVAMISIIAVVVFVAFDPMVRFKDARDSARWSDMALLSEALNVDRQSNIADFITANTIAEEVYMIGTDTSNCDIYDSVCDTDIVTSTNCLDMTTLVTEGNLEVVPVSPNGEGNWTAGHTGFTLSRASTGVITLRSCESENSSEIKILKYPE